MKVFLDTNILFSAILFPGSTPDLAFQKAFTEPMTAITSDYCIEELTRKFSKKFPNKVESLESFVEALITCADIVNTSNKETNDEKLIRDVKDRPVLRAAIEAGADVIITGDKDLLDSNVKCPKIMTASEFYKNY